MRALMALPEFSSCSFSVSALCSHLGISRQAYYQACLDADARRLEEELVLGLVREERCLQPQLGVRKLLVNIGSKMDALEIKMGRDALFSLLGTVGLLVKRKRGAPKTTFAGSFRCQNHLRDRQIQSANEAFVSDITYLSTESGFVYLALLTDVYSRKIVGYNVSSSLCVEGALSALEMATKNHSEVKGCIHHSDRGIQYTCKAYRKCLSDLEMISSMGEAGNCYDNAIAERVNGILKQEYNLYRTFRDLAESVEAVKEAIMLYNTRRPHSSLKMQYPETVYLESQSQIKEQVLGSFF